VLAAAGGLHAATYEISVELTRDGVRESVPLSRVLSDPKENIFLRPGDVLAVTRQPQSFTAFGATGRAAQINFDQAQLSLVEAVGKAGGLLDARSDPRGVYLFRSQAQTGTPAEPGPGDAQQASTTAHGTFIDST